MPFKPAYAAATLALALSTSCAFVEFELAPYAPRRLQVVYSAQEDLTFLSWRLGGTADPGSIVTELFDGTSYRALELADAPYPAEPYACQGELCFQYQLAGRFEPAANVALLRTIHPRFGEYPSPRAALREVEETVAIDPIAIERNRRVDPRRFDWFAEEEVPLRRAYGWRFVDGPCGTATTAAFAPIENFGELPEAWTGRPACIELAPRRRDAQGVIVAAPLVASAETQLIARQRYDAPSAAHRTLYGVLFDLAVADPARCAEVRSVISMRLADAIARRDPQAVRIGEFDPEGIAQCSAAAPDRYPIQRMLAAAQDAALATTGEYKTIVWIYVGNRTDADSNLEEAWRELIESSAGIDPSPVYDWFIAAPIRAFAAGARWVTNYRAIEDATLVEDIDTTVALAVPFRTLVHDGETQIALTVPPPRPAWARVCQSVPAIATLRVDGRDADPRAFEWPRRDAPLYTVDLGTQLGVPAEEFADRSSNVQVEICTAFCDGPFRTAAGVDHPSWQQASVCAGHP